MTKHLKLSALVLIATAFLGGCYSIQLDQSGDMVATYISGQFNMVLNTTAPVAAKAANAALAQFDLYQTKSVTNTYDARIEARARNDQKVLIIIEEINSRQTMLRIRWGAGGDEVKSRRLYEAVEAGLPNVK